MFEAVIFDFDGVILDSEPLHFEAISKALQKLDINLTWSEFQENYSGLRDTELFSQLFQHKNFIISEEATKGLIKLKIKYYRDIIANHVELPMVKDLDNYIHQLIKNKIKIAICSGSARSEINIVLEKLQSGKFLKYFDPIISAEDVKHGKPSPEGYLLAAQRLQIAPEKCLVIEDGQPGILAAKSAGMRVIGLLTTLPRSKLSQADNIIHDFGELLV